METLQVIKNFSQKKNIHILPLNNYRYCKFLKILLGEKNWKTQGVTVTALQTLSEMYENLVEERLCKICYDRNRDTLFEPCLHLACCNNCSGHLFDCPICNAEIHIKMQIYFP